MIHNKSNYKAFIQGFAVILLLMAAMGLSLGCQSEAARSGITDVVQRAGDTTVEKSDEDIVVNETGETSYAYLKQIEKDWPKRVAGSEEELQMSQWLEEELAGMGYTTEIQKFSFNQEDGVSTSSQNVIGVIHPESETRIILGAHYDSVSDGQGADDNGSGVAALLSLAKSLAAGESTHRIEIVFFGAEEVGIVGSEAYAKAYVGDSVDQKVGKASWPALMLNYDSLIAGDHCYVYAGAMDDLNRSRLLLMAESLDMPLLTQSEKRSGLDYGTTVDASDHFPFKQRGIPILYFEATNWGIGQYDGYEQTSNERVEGQKIWHTDQDTLVFIEGVFGDRPLKHLSLFTEMTLKFLEDYEGS